MATQNLDAFDLKNINLDGLIHEDVMNTIFDISKIPLPFADRAGTGTHSNQKFTWTMDKLNPPVTTGQLIDGQTVTSETNVVKNGRRVGNHSEIRGKRVEVSTRAQDVNTIGFANALAYQITQRQHELRRDVDATCLSNNGSVEGTDAVAGVQAGLAAWLTDVDVDGAASVGLSNVFRGAGGADGGWDAVATDSLVAASTPGTPEALTDTKIRDIQQAIYEKGGEPSVLMTTPAIKRRISEFNFTDAARIASLINDDPGGSAPQRKAQGSVDLLLNDFGALELVPNRLQPAYDTGNDVAFIMDFSFVEISFLHGYNVIPLAKDSLADDRFMFVDYGLRVKNWDALGAIYDIDPAAAMTA
jgi:Family of unknown function (DUF5309)